MSNNEKTRKSAIDPRVKRDAFFTPTVVLSGTTARRPKNRKIEDFGKSVIEDLAHRKTVPQLCVKYDASRQSVHYWAHRAEEKGLIVRDGLDPINNQSKLYRRGPNYHLLSYEEWQDPDFLQPYARIHFGNGSRVNVHALNIETENLLIPVSEGVYRREPLFVKPAKTSKYMNWYNAAVIIPEEVIGYSGAQTTVTYCENLTDWTKSYLALSPPEIRQTLDSLKEDFDLELMKNVIAYVISVFEDGDWQVDSEDTEGLEGCPWKEELHYAIDYRTVKKLCPALTEGVHRLGPAEREEDFDLFYDHSHGQYELETTNRGLAIEMLSLMEANRKRLNGKKRDRRPGSPDIF
jgi:hypothetical protein